MQTKNIVIVLVGIVIIIAAFAISNDGFYMMDEDHFDEMAEEMNEYMFRDHDDGNVASYEIYPGDVVKKIQNGEDFILLDVRTPEEYEEFHLKNSLLLPVQELSAKSLADIGLGENAKDKEIIIYCRSGARSQTAYNIMDSLGYTNIKSIAGGTIHWQEDNYPYTESGTGTAGSNYYESNTIDSGARISLSNTFYDFGEIPQFGGKVTKDFVVRNTGTGDLIIGDITTSCSCTSAVISRNTIPSGETATVTVIFDPDFHEEPLGVFKRTVFIPTNDPNTPEAEISIQVDILEGE